MQKAQVNRCKASLAARVEDSQPARQALFVGRFRIEAVVSTHWGRLFRYCLIDESQPEEGNQLLDDFMSPAGETESTTGGSNESKRRIGISYRRSCLIRLKNMNQLLIDSANLAGKQTPTIGGFLESGGGMTGEININKHFMRIK